MEKIERVHIMDSQSASGAVICCNLMRMGKRMPWRVELVAGGESHSMGISDALELLREDGAPDCALTMRNVCDFLSGMFD